MEALPRRHRPRASGSTTRTTYAVEKVPQPDGRCNDTDPMWIGDTVYFRSDRDGEFNLFAFDRATKAVTQLTEHADFPVLNASAGGGRIVYEQAGYLHLLDPATGSVAAADDRRRRRTSSRRGRAASRERSTSATRSLSPSGARVAFEFRGEIVTVPAEKGDARNLTQHARRPRALAAWSPDGKSIAYFSDAGGEYELVARRAGRQGRAAKRSSSTGAGFYEQPAWSPDSKKIASPTTRARSTGSTWRRGKVDEGRVRAALRPGAPCCTTPGRPTRSGSPTRCNNAAYINRLYVYSLGDGQVVPGHRRPDRRERAGLRRRRQVPLLPRLDRRRARSTTGSRSRTPTCGDRAAIYLAVLRRTCRRRSRRRATRRRRRRTTRRGRREGGRDEAGRRTTRRRPRTTKADKKPVEVKIDFDGLEQRILDAAGAGRRATPTCRPGDGRPGLLPGAPAADRPGRRRRRLPLRPREAQGRDARSTRRRRLRVSADGKKRRCYASKDDWSIVDVGRQDRACAKGKLDVGRDRGAGRSARRVDADLRRGLAHQPRLLLRPEHARRRLEGDAREVRGRSCRTSRRAAT